MKEQQQPIMYEDGQPLEAHLVEAQCNLGSVIKELWKVNSQIPHDVCHMCCFKHRRGQCTYLKFGATPPCCYYNKEFGYTHFFNDLQPNNVKQ